MFQNCSKSRLIGPECSRSRTVFIGRPVQSGQRFAHHQKLRLAVPLENLGVALAKQLRYKVVGNATSTQSRGKCVPEVVEREIGNLGAL